MDRLDALLDRKLADREAEQARADASLEDARRAKMREAAEARTEIASLYAHAYRSFGSEPPMALDDEPPSRYRARLFNRLVRRLPQNHEWSSTRADDIPAGPQRWTTSKRW